MSGVLARMNRWRDPVTVPPLDGPWTPNDALEAGRVLHQDEDVVDAALTSTGLVVLTRGSLLLLDAESGNVLRSAELDATGTALCAAPRGLLVALEGHGLVAFDGGTLDRAAVSVRSTELPRRCVTAMVHADGVLWVAEGSSERGIDDWKRDLLTRGSTGSVWRADTEHCERYADNLAWPSGLAVGADRRVVVAEAWRHRLVQIDGTGRPTPVVDDLPAYPGLITPGADDGFHLACPLPRSSLVEFVMNEPGFLRSMFDEIDERGWVAPQLRTLRHPLEQVQGGELLVFGQVKPWAPTRSYGLAAVLDAQLKPLRSLHSRANGRQHGISRVLAHGDRLLVVSRGAGTVSEVPVPPSW
jgi:hypothetical protein